MKVFFLVVFLFINGTWVAGSTLDGWDPVPYSGLTACLVAKARAEAVYYKEWAPGRPVPPVWLCLAEEELP